MLSVDEHFDQVRYLKSIQVYARGGRSHFGHYRSMTVHKTEEYASSCRLADGRGNSGGRESAQCPTLILSRRTNCCRPANYIFPDVSRNKFLAGQIDRPKAK
jgi:hypothetical protein